MLQILFQVYHVMSCFESRCYFYHLRKHLVIVLWIMKSSLLSTLSNIYTRLFNATQLSRWGNTQCLTKSVIGGIPEKPEWEVIYLDLGGVVDLKNVLWPLTFFHYANPVTLTSTRAAILPPPFLQKYEQTSALRHGNKLISSMLSCCGALRAVLIQIPNYETDNKQDAH